MRMKCNGIVWMLAGMLLIAVSCNSEEQRFLEPEIDENLIVLSHDGPNVDAPLLPAQTYEAAVRFTSSEVGVAVGGRLKEIHFFIRIPPQNCEVRVYTSKGGNTPDRLIYQREVTRTISADAWNKHTLINPIPLNTDDLWIAVRFSHDTDQRTLGCDPGPANANGDWLLDESDGRWLPLRQRSSININWNIRAAVER